MKLKPLLRKSVFVGASLLAITSCGKKKSSSAAPASDGSVEPNEDTIVTLATGSLQLSGDVTILKGKEGAANLALGMKEVSFNLLADREVRLRVTNEAFETVERAGSIMCFLSQTKFWEQANLGVYQAHVDEKKCEKNSGGGDQGGDQGSQSSNESPELTVTYINSVREENKPLVAEMRLSGGDGAYYHVRVIVVEPPSDSAPAGIFDMRYTARMGDQQGIVGFIRTKRTSGGKFVLETGAEGNEGGNRTEKSQGIAELEVQADGTVLGYIHSDSNGTEGDDRSYSSKGIARFNGSYLNVDFKSAYKEGPNVGENVLQGCYDLNKYKTAMFRYDLVGADGKSVPLNSGFPVEYEKDGKLLNGWAGYHGLWLGPDVSIASGATVNKVSWTDGNKTKTPYKVFSAPGKLAKLTKSTVTLGALKGVDLSFFDAGSNYIVKWDGSTLSKTAKISYTDKGPEEEAASGAITIPQWGAHLWIPSLNASVQISNAMTLSDALSLSYHSEKIVSGTSEVPTCNLVCFSNCPTMTPTADNFKQQTSAPTNGPMTSALYLSTTTSWGTSNQTQNILTPLATYTWDASTQNLKLGTTAFTLPSGLTTNEKEAQQLQHIHSGALVCSDVHDAIADKTGLDPYRMQNEVTTYYRFTSGAQSWSKFVSLRDAADKFVTFDAPLQLSYTHTTANDWDGNTDTSFIGKTFRLEYNGPGNLHGIPWKFAKDIGHHMPLFSIKGGAAVGAYTLYPMDGEQRLAKTDTANCSSIPLDGAPDLPVLDDKSVNVGNLGDENSELRYIGGVSVK